MEVPRLFIMEPARELLEKCKKDDRKAHYELYKMCFPFLLSVCRRYFNNSDDIQSAINQIYFRVIVNMSSYLKKEAEVPFNLWMRRLAINLIIDEFRKNKKYREQIDHREITEAEHLHPYSDPLVEKEQMEEITEAIGQLSHMNRTVFNLYVLDGYGHDEIAGMLNISSGTSKVHLYRAKKRLQELLEHRNKKKVMSKHIFQ